MRATTSLAADIELTILVGRLLARGWTNPRQIARGLGVDASQVRRAMIEIVEARPTPTHVFTSRAELREALERRRWPLVFIQCAIDMRAPSADGRCGFCQAEGVVALATSPREPEMALI